MILEAGTGIRQEVVAGEIVSFKSNFPVFNLLEIEGKSEAAAGRQPGKSGDKKSRSSESSEYQNETSSVGDNGYIDLIVYGKNLAIDLESGKVDTAGEEGVSDLAIRTGYIAIQPERHYTISKAFPYEESKSNCMVRIYDREKHFLGSLTGLRSNDLSNTITDGFLSDGAAFIRIVQYKSVTETFDGQKLQIEEGDEATAYEEPVSQTISIPLSQPLKSNENIKDKICLRNGLWGTERYINQERTFEPLDTALQRRLNTLVTYPSTTMTTGDSLRPRIKCLYFKEEA